MNLRPQTAGIISRNRSARGHRDIDICIHTLPRHRSGCQKEEAEATRRLHRGGNRKCERFAALEWFQDESTRVEGHWVAFGAFSILTCCEHLRKDIRLLTRRVPI